MPKTVTDTRTTILKVALQLFLEKGYKEVSYQDLVRETGLSKGAIYHHFSSKDDLLAQVFVFLLDATHPPPDAETIQVTDQQTFVQYFLAAKQDQLNGLKAIMGNKQIKLNKLLFFLEAINENEQIKQNIRTLMDEEQNFIEQCFMALRQHQAIPPAKDPRLLAKNLYWMLQGAEMRLFLEQKKEWDDTLLQIYTETITDFFEII